MMGVASKNNKIHFGVAAWHWGSYFEDKMKGIRLCISDWIRPDPRSAPCKSKAAGLYMICTLAKDKQNVRGRIFSLLEMVKYTRRLMTSF